VSVVVEQLSKVYGNQRAVDELTFEVKKGQVVGFLGPNGAGKSTTMKMLTTYISPSSGSAQVAGYDIAADALEVRKQVGYLPEHNPLYTEMYVKEYLYFMADLNGLSKEGRTRSNEMIERTGLGPEQHKRIGQLSKGYRQRVGLAQAMIHNPEVLILDEPTSGLDPNQVLEIRNLIREFGSERTIILSTHIMQEVEAMCDRVLIINKGKLVADEPISEIKKKFTGTSGLRIGFRDAVALEDLQKLNGVEKVIGINERSFEIYGPDDVKLREVLFEFGVSSKNVILEQSTVQQSLEDVFRILTRS
jgi:ABC-2 type transport system ATP-binding protein